jgi:hypothetical protein
MNRGKPGMAAARECSDNAEHLLAGERSRTRFLSRRFSYWPRNPCSWVSRRMVFTRPRPAAVVLDGFPEAGAGLLDAVAGDHPAKVL